MTWGVTCPNWANKKHANTKHDWSLSPNELSFIGENYFEPRIDCEVCGKKFSLQEGVKEEFISSQPFTINHFLYNSYERGTIEIDVGHSKTTKFSKPFEDLPIIYLTFGEPISAIYGNVRLEQFDVFCCESQGAAKIGNKKNIYWHAYGNRDIKNMPLWREIISSSKIQQVRKDYRAEILNLETAFEVFISEYIGDKLKLTFNESTIEWILDQGITNELKYGFSEIKGNSLANIEKEAYVKWVNDVYKLRNLVIHKGKNVTEEQIKKAREAIFELITRIEPSTINHFQILYM